MKNDRKNKINGTFHSNKPPPQCSSDEINRSTERAKTHCFVKFSLTIFAFFLLFALCIAPVSAVSTWNGVDIDISWYNSGNENDQTYYLSTAAQLAGLSKLVNDSRKTFVGDTVILADDIDLGNHEWTPIGYDSNRVFQGTFDGANHTVSNMKITEINVDNVGLFGSFEGADLKNIGLINVDINISLDSGTYGAEIGGLVGSLGSVSRQSNVTNCYVTGNIHSAITSDRMHRVGGIAAIVSGSKSIYIANCYSDVNIYCGELSNYAGGLFGAIRGIETSDKTISVENCYALGDVSSVVSIPDTNNIPHAGGLVGEVLVSNCPIKIKNCYAVGNISSVILFGGEENASNQSIAGGLIGTIVNPAMVQSVEVSNSFAGNNYIKSVSTSYNWSFAGRIAGLYSRSDSLINNYANADMMLDKFGTSKKYSSSSYQGLNITGYKNNISFFKDTLQWDFDNVWKMSSSSPYPVLSWQNVPIQPTPEPTPMPVAPSVITIYNPSEGSLVPINHPTQPIQYAHASAKYSNGSYVPYDMIVWSVNNISGSLSINSDGQYCGVSAGTAQITASVLGYPDVKASVNVTVSNDPPCVSNIQVGTGSAGTLTPGSYGTAYARLTDQYGIWVNEQVTWTSSNPSVLSIDSAGSYRANSIGKAALFATSASGFIGSCTLYVAADSPVVTYIEISDPQPNQHMIVGEKSWHGVTLYDQYHHQNNSWSEISWVSSDPSVLNVSGYEIEALKAGTAVLTAQLSSNPSISETVIVRVDTAREASVASYINKSSYNSPCNDSILAVNQRGTAHADILDQYGKSMHDAQWSSSNSSVITITPDGKYTAVGEGSAVLTAKSPSNLLVAENMYVDVVSFNSPAPTQLNPASVNISYPQWNHLFNISDIGTAIANVSDQNGSFMPSESVNWTSSDQSVLNISLDGFFTAEKAGNVTLTATAVNNTSAFSWVNVSVKHGAIPNKPVIEFIANVTNGSSVWLNVTNPEPAVSYSWTVNNAPVVGNTSNVSYTPSGVGKYTVVVNSANLNGTSANSDAVIFSVTDNLIPASVNISYPQWNHQFNISDIGTALANVSDQNGNLMLSESVNWTSSDSAIVSITELGFITAEKAGNVTLTATAVNNTSAFAFVNISVLTGYIPSKPIIAPIANVTNGSSVWLNVTNPEPSVSYNWTVNGNHVPGNTSHISYTPSGVGDYIVIVNATNLNGTSANSEAVIFSVTDNLIPASVNISYPFWNQQFNISDTGYANATVLNQFGTAMPSEHVNWTSSDSAIVTIDTNTGLFTAEKAGNVTLTATAVNNASASAFVNISVLTGYIPAKPIIASIADITNGSSVWLNVTNPENNVGYNWTVNGNHVPGNTSHISYTPSGVGNYTVIVNAANLNGTSVSDPVYFNVTDEHYNVTFRPNNGTDAWWNVSVVQNGLVDKPDNPIYNGHTFVGWNTSANAQWNFTADTVISDMTLTGSWTVNEVYYNVTFNPNNNSANWNIRVLSGNNVSKPSDPIKSGYTFIGWNNTADGLLWNFTTPVTSEVNLIANYSIIPAPQNTYFSGGEGSFISPYQINTLQDLLNLSYLTNTKSVNEEGIEYAALNYTVTSNINLQQDGMYYLDGTAYDKTNWMPIGNTTNTVSANRAFKGNFNGSGYTITGLNISRLDTDYQGFFGNIDEASVKNVVLDVSYVTGNSYVGGLIGMASDSIIEKSSVSINGRVDTSTGPASHGVVGGLIGKTFDSDVDSCYVSGNVGNPDINRVGGLIGENGRSSADKSVTNCSSFCSVIGDNYVGGIVGYNNGQSLINCIAVGIVSGDSNIGGVVGYRSGGKIEKCVSLNSQISGDSYVGRILGGWNGGSSGSIYGWDGAKDKSGSIFKGDGNSGVNGTSASSDDVWNNQSFYESIGFDFIGIWTMNSGNSDYQLPVLKWQSLPVTGDTSYLNRSVPVSYNVTFNPNNGSANWNVSVLSGETVAEPTPAPTKNNHTLISWNTTAGIEFDFTAPITSDTVLIANYTLNGCNITAAAGANGVISPSGTVTVPHGADRTFTITPNEGYRTADITVDGSAQLINDTYTFTNVVSDHSISANFTIKTYNVSFLNNTGTGFMANQTFDHGVNQQLNPSTFTKDDKVFAGWDTNSAGITVVHNDNATISVTADTALYAVWKEPVRYNVTFNPNNNSSSWNVSVITGNNVSKPADPIKAGYSFLAWNTTIGTEFDFAAPITSDTVLIANYTKNLVYYNVTFNPNNGSANWNVSVLSGNPVVKPAQTPSKYGYKFIGWNNTTSGAVWNFTTPITDNVSLIADYKEIEYTVTIVSPPAMLYSGEIGNLTASVVTTEGNVLNTERVTWSSDNGKLTIDRETGSFTVNDGTPQTAEVTITATSVNNTSIKGTAVISVKNVPTANEVVITSAPTNLTVGDTGKVTAVVKDQYGQIMNGKAVNWSIPNPTGALILDSAGNYRANTSGTETIKAEFGGKSTTADVIISDSEIVPAQPSITVGTTKVGIASEFTAAARDATSFVWDWGDGTKTTTSADSGKSTTTHSYAENIAYTLTVTPYNKQTVGPAKTETFTPAFTAPTNVIIRGASAAVKNDETVFTVTATGADSYDWEVSGGSIESGQNTATVIVKFTDTGSKSVSVIAKRGDTSASQVTKTVTVTEPDTAITAPNDITVDRPILKGEPVKFTAVGGTTGKGYEWDFGGAKVTSSTNSVYYAITEETNVKVASVNSTVKAWSEEITFTPGDAPTDLAINSNSEGTVETAVTFRGSATGATSYAWSFGDGQTSRKASPGDVTYNAAGTYMVQFTATNVYGSSTVTKLITIKPKQTQPPAVTIVGPSAILSGQVGSYAASVVTSEDITGYSWTLDGAILGTGSSAAVGYNSISVNGSTLKLTVTTAQHTAVDSMLITKVVDTVPEDTSKDEPVNKVKPEIVNNGTSAVVVGKIVYDQSDLDETADYVNVTITPVQKDELPAFEGEMGSSDSALLALDIKPAGLNNEKDLKMGGDVTIYVPYSVVPASEVDKVSFYRYDTNAAQPEYKKIQIVSKIRNDGVGWTEFTIRVSGHSTIAAVMNSYAGVQPPTPVPTSAPSGHSQDTGSGNYKEYDRSVTDGGKVLFGTSPIVTSVDLPKGTKGQVILVAESKTPAPEGKETVKVFEINIPNYPIGEPATVQFKLTVAEIEKAGYSPEDICLYHCDENGVWTKLPTTYVIKDGVVYYEAVTTAFSPFAIVYEEGAAQEDTAIAVITPTAVKTETVPTYVEPAVPAEETAKPEKTASPVDVIGLIAGLGVAVAILRRK